MLVNQGYRHTPRVCNCFFTAKVVTQTRLDVTFICILNVLLKDRPVFELTQPHIKGTYKYLARVEKSVCKLNPVDSSEGSEYGANPPG